MVDGEEGGDLRRLADFLADPRERMDVELKQWLDLSDRRVASKVARHLMALANHGGGWLQFGFVENDDGQFVHESEQGCPNETMYSSDAINSVVRRCAQPAFQCETFWQSCEQCPGPHTLVRVPGGHRVPIVCKRGGPEPNPDPRRGAVYGRLSGPRSEALEDPEREVRSRDHRVDRENVSAGPAARRLTVDRRVPDRQIEINPRSTIHALQTTASARRLANATTWAAARSGDVVES